MSQCFYLIFQRFLSPLRQCWHPFFSGTAVSSLSAPCEAAAAAAAAAGSERLSEYRQVGGVNKAHTPAQQQHNNFRMPFQHVVSPLQQAQAAVQQKENDHGYTFVFYY